MFSTQHKLFAKLFIWQHQRLTTEKRTVIVEKEEDYL